MFDKVWVKDTAERLLKTFLQVFVGTLLVSIPDTESLDWTGFITWQRAAVMGAIAAVLSVRDLRSVRAAEGDHLPRFARLPPEGLEQGRM